MDNRLDPLPNQPGSRDLFIQTEDRTAPRDSQTGPAFHRNAGTARSRKGFLAPLLDALYESRRLQAARIIHEYGHLIAKDQSFKSPDKFSEHKIPPGWKPDMANDDYPNVQRSAKSMSFKTWILITTIVVFGIIHVAGGIILSNASSAWPTETSLVAIRGD